MKKNKSTLKKFKNSLEFDFTVTVKLDKKDCLLKNVECSLEEAVKEMIDNAISEYCGNCGDGVTECGDADDDCVWVAATYPRVEIEKA